jgi:hypothetical protein
MRPGVVYQTAREIQRRFTIEAQRETATGATPRYSRAQHER